MPRDGSGTYSRTDGTRNGPETFDEQRVQVETIDASNMDHHANDMAEALTESVAKDGQTQMTGDLNMGTNQVKNLAEATAASDAATLGQLLALAIPFVTSDLVGGTGNGIALTPTPAVTEYEIGKGFRFFAEEANDDEATLSALQVGAPRPCADVALGQRPGHAVGRCQPPNPTVLGPGRRDGRRRRRCIGGVRSKRS